MDNSNFLPELSEPFAQDDPTSPRKKPYPMEGWLLDALQRHAVPIVDFCAIYDQEKAKFGLRLSEVKRTDLISVYAVVSMNSPHGFHIELDFSYCDEKELPKILQYLPKLLKRFGRSIVMAEAWSSQILFFYKVEYSRGKLHVHLYCIADGWLTHEIRTLERLLAKRLKCKAKALPRAPVEKGLRKIIFSVETGEELKNTPHSRVLIWHSLKTEFEDWRRRSSYAAKNHTRQDIGSFSSFHCSRVRKEWIQAADPLKKPAISTPKNGRK